MVQLPPRPDSGRAISKAAQPIRSKPKPSLDRGVAIQSAKDRARSVMQKIRGGRPVPGNPLLEQYLGAMCEEGPDGDALRAQLLARAREELDRRKNLVRPLGDLLEPFRTPQARLKLQRNVLGPAKSRKTSSRETVDALHEFFDHLTTSPITQWLESIFGPLTIGVAGGIEFGAGAGIEEAMGIAFRRHCCVAVTRSQALALGAYAEIAASVQVSLSGGSPSAGESVTIDCSVSYASGGSIEATISLEPSFHEPTLKPSKEKDWSSTAIFGGDVYRGFVVDYSFAGLSLSVGAGGGGKAGAAGVTATSAFLLPGPPLL